MCGQHADSKKLERKYSYCLPGIVYIKRARELSVLGVAVPLSAIGGHVNEKPEPRDEEAKLSLA